jgi:O-methyltransferase
MTTDDPSQRSSETSVDANAEMLRDRYLTLLQRSLTRFQMDAETSYTPIEGVGHVVLGPVIQGVQRLLRTWSHAIVKYGPPDNDVREDGRDWPMSAETMVGMKRLSNLRECLEQIFTDHVPGDVLEAGVWRGGSSIFMRGVIVAYGETDRRSWVADSFAGLPKTEPGRYPSDKGLDLFKYDQLSVSLENVKANFAKYNLLDDSVHFLKGWFEDTLPTAPIDQLALLRLDGDLYSSTIQTLDALYDKVSDGGYLVVDDYGSIPACKQATNDFRARRGIEDEIHVIDWAGVYWRKSKA